MQFRKIDDNGFFVEDVITDEFPETQDEQGNTIYDTHYISVPCPGGFYIPKWDGFEWVEGMLQEQIDAIKNKTQEPTQEKRISALEKAFLASLS